ncbi:MAG: hypothetical protein OEZ24_00315 [Candidatus Bathyarchaeota archaeon]|nr:hypothetical protein [Candidatus Bathyarchaeota archaeon]
MGFIEIFAVPAHLRVASNRMARIIRSSEPDALFLYLPQHLNDLIKSLAEGCPYEYLLDQVKESSLVPEPLGRWEYGMEPMLLAIRGILNRKRGLEIWCYKEPSFVKLSADFAANIAELVLRASVTGKVNDDDWRAVAKGFLEASADTLDKEAEYVAERSKGKGKNICICGMEGRIFRDRLSEYNLEMKPTYVLLPYYFTPIEILARQIGKEPGGSARNGNRVFQIAKHQIEFVREYVLTSRDYDEAYLKWVGDTGPCAKSRRTLFNTPTSRTQD